MLGVTSLVHEEFRRAIVVWSLKTHIRYVKSTSCSTFGRPHFAILTVFWPSTTDLTVHPQRFNWDAQESVAEVLPHLVTLDADEEISSIQRFHARTAHAPPNQRIHVDKEGSPVLGLLGKKHRTS